MSVIEVYECNHCGKIISRVGKPISITAECFPIEPEPDHFIIAFRSPRFADAAGGIDRSVVLVDLCEDCEREFRGILLKILEVAGDGNKEN